jgi:hypothetical protein
MNEIEKTEGEIKVLQAKLELLKEMENFKTPVEEAYKRWWGEYPGTEIWTKDDEIRWVSFSAGYNASQSKNAEPYCPDEPEYYDEVEWDKKDNPKPMDEVVDRLVKKYQAQKLWNRVRDELGYSTDCCDEIVDAVEEWLPKPQSAAGSQNVDTELLVDGFNHCLTKIKGKLR